jgi:phosphate starvation-inducible protein PhoH and related proteins
MKTKRIDQTKVQDHSPSIPQRNKIKNQLSIRNRELNDKQKQFLEIAMDKNTKIVFVSGPAGTSKTYMAVYAALQLLNERRISDIIYIRSAVESSESKLGFLPGEADEKMAPYLAPLIDKLTELLPIQDIESLKKDERISSVPVGFLRGLNWNAKVIITDEAQNMTAKELFTLITRTGEFSKVFILGDPDQSDINGKSGFTKIISHFEDEESKSHGIRVFKFTEDDIVRSALVKFIIKKVKKTI